MKITELNIDALPYRPCVGIVLVNGQGKVFAAQRLDNFKDAWQMPQGGIDKDEEPEAAALRELKEETGIEASSVTVVARTKESIPYDLPKDLVPKLWKGRFRGQSQIWFLLRFHGDDSEINIETEEPEFSKWVWMDRKELIERIVPFKKRTYELVFAEFEAALS